METVKRLAWVDMSIRDLAIRAREADHILTDTLPVLVIEEDGDFRVDYLGERGEKNILLSGDWVDGFLAGQFYLVAVPGTITPAPGLFSGGS